MLYRCLVNMDVLLLKMLIMVSGFLLSELCCEGEFITNPFPLVGNWTVDQKRWGICTWKMCQFDLFLEIVKWDGHSIRPAIWLVVTVAKRIVKWGGTYIRVKTLDGKDSFECVCFPSSHRACNTLILTCIRLIDREGNPQGSNMSMYNSVGSSDVVACKRTRQ